MSSQNREIKYALVTFLKDSVKKIVSVKLIIFDRKNESSFKPQTCSDYDPKHKYYVRWYYCGEGGDICSGDDECEHPHDLYSAFIIYLSETRKDIEMQLQKGKRMPVTNRKYVTTTTESDEEDQEMDEVTKIKEKMKIDESKKKAALNKRNCMTLKKVEMAFTAPNFSDCHQQENESHNQKNENNGIGQIMSSKSKIQLKDVRVNLENINSSTSQSNNNNNNSSKQGQQTSHDKQQECVSSPQSSELSTPKSTRSSQNSSKNNSLRGHRISGLRRSLLFDDESDTEDVTPPLQNRSSPHSDLLPQHKSILWNNKNQENAQSLNENVNEGDEHTGEHEAAPHNDSGDNASDQRNPADVSAFVRSTNIHEPAAPLRHNTCEPAGGLRNTLDDNQRNQRINADENAGGYRDNPHEPAAPLRHNTCEPAGGLRNNLNDNQRNQRINADENAGGYRDNPGDNGADQHNNPGDNAADQQNHADGRRIYTRSNDFLLSCISYYEGAREGHARREKQNRYTLTENEEIYLGENISMDRTAWEFLQVERPSYFLVTVAKHLWGGSLKLANRAFDLTHNVDNIPGRSPVKLIEHNLLRLLISLYFDFLKRNKALTSTERAKLMSQAIDDVRYAIRNLRAAEKKNLSERPGSTR